MDFFYTGSPSRVIEILGDKLFAGNCINSLNNGPKDSARTGKTKSFILLQWYRPDFWRSCLDPFHRDNALSDPEKLENIINVFIAVKNYSDRYNEKIFVQRFFNQLMVVSEISKDALKTAQDSARKKNAVKPLSADPASISESIKKHIFIVEQILMDNYRFSQTPLLLVYGDQIIESAVAVQLVQREEQDFLLDSVTLHCPDNAFKNESEIQSDIIALKSVINEFLLHHNFAGLSYFDLHVYFKQPSGLPFSGFPMTGQSYQLPLTIAILSAAAGIALPNGLVLTGGVDQLGGLEEVKADGLKYRYASSAGMKYFSCPKKNSNAIVNGLIQNGPAILSGNNLEELVLALKENKVVDLFPVQSFSPTEEMDFFCFGIIRRFFAKAKSFLPATDFRNKERNHRYRRYLRMGLLFFSIAFAINLSNFFIVQYPTSLIQSFAEPLRYIISILTAPFLYLMFAWGIAPQSSDTWKEPVENAGKASNNWSKRNRSIIASIAEYAGERKTIVRSFFTMAITLVLSAIMTWKPLLPRCILPSTTMPVFTDIFLKVSIFMLYFWLIISNVAGSAIETRLLELKGFPMRFLFSQKKQKPVATNKWMRYLMFSPWFLIVLLLPVILLLSFYDFDWLVSFRKLAKIPTIFTRYLQFAGLLKIFLLIGSVIFVFLSAIISFNEIETKTASKSK